jgi:hypothetical protein
MENLELYNKVRNVPTEAQKIIGGGRLKGMTDINPMWRIKTLTENFGTVGFGWYYEILEQRLEKGSDNQVAAFVTINLFVKVNEEWSKPIIGIGGSSFVTNEKGGAYTSDECFKMALTDAIGIACKALGFGADIYWSSDRTKYSDADKKDDKPNYNTQQNAPISKNEKKEITPQQKEVGKLIVAKYGQESAVSKLVEMTEFEINGKKVAGKSELHLLTDKQVVMLLSKLKTDNKGVVERESDLF